MPKRSPRAAPTARESTAVRASPNGTQQYVSRHRARFVSDFYRTTGTGLSASSLALGTYLGASDDGTDLQYADALRAALLAGVNVVDTAINYRCQRAERVVGRVLREMEQANTLRRDEVILCTKGGYIPLDAVPFESRDAYSAYVKREYLDPGILTPEDIVGGGHAITPAFLTDQLSRSLRNLGVESVDYFYVHNPEQQLSSVPATLLRERLRAAFQALEREVEGGRIGAYGCSTWSGLRIPAGSQGHLSLYDLVTLAREVGGDSHHFRIVQIPVNLSMPEAVRISTQRNFRGRLVHLLDAAIELGIDIVVSAPLLQGQLTRDLPDTIRSLFSASTDAQRALMFARGLPGITSVAVGMRRPAHVAENLAAFVAM